MRTREKIKILTLILITGAMGPALAVRAEACGFCARDKESAVYRYESIERSKRLNAHYVVVQVIGADSAGAFASAVAALKRAPGVLPETLNTSYPLRAISFVARRVSLPSVKGGIRFKVLKDEFEGVSS